MADISAERDSLIDGMPRDERGYWQPEGIKLPNPIFAWPPKPVEVAKWVFNYMFPWNIIYMAIARADSHLSAAGNGPYEDVQR